MKQLKKSIIGFSLLATNIFCLTMIAQAQIQIDRPKVDPPLDNPYTLGIAREKILETAREVLKTCNIPLNTDLSKQSEGKIVTQPIVFSRGVTTRSDLEYLAAMPANEVRDWAQGRYILEISALPLDQKRSQLFISARIQGRVAGYTGKEEWVEGQSNGRLEDEVMRGLAGKILGIDLSLKKNSSRPTRRILNCEY